MQHSIALEETSPGPLSETGMPSECAVSTNAARVLHYRSPLPADAARLCSLRACVGRAYRTDNAGASCHVCATVPFGHVLTTFFDIKEGFCSPREGAVH